MDGGDDKQQADITLGDESSEGEEYGKIDNLSISGFRGTFQIQKFKNYESSNGINFKNLKYELNNNFFIIITHDLKKTFN